MLKILYAAGNNQNAGIMLSRFLAAVKGNPAYWIKVAAYRQSTPEDIPIDWTLDCLLDMYRPSSISLHNNANLEIYFQQVKYFRPDLVISDLEYFTSHIASVLDITLWQCSSSIIHFAMQQGQYHGSGLRRRYWQLFKADKDNNQRTIYLLTNSNWNGVYSPFGDMLDPPKLKTGYEWVRPYHGVGKDASPCQHNVVAALLYNDKHTLGALQHSFDSVAFTPFPHEQYPNLTLKSLHNTDEYYCNVRGCNLFACRGQTSFIADGFYNGKYSALFTNFDDTECLLNSMLAQRFGISQFVGDAQQLTSLQPKLIQPKYRTKIRYLHERLDEL